MRTLWLRPFVLLLAGLSAGFSPTGWNWAAESDDDVVAAEKLLPPETLFFFSVPDVPALTEALEGTAYGKLLKEPKLQPFLDDLRAKQKEADSKLEDELGLTLEDLLKLPQGEITLAVVEKPARKLAAVLMFDTGENAETLDKLVEKMDGALAAQGADHSTQEVGEVEVHVYKLPGGDDNPIKTLAYFTEEGYIVFATEVAAIKSVLERWSGESEETLAEQDVFAYIQKKCQNGEEEALVKWYLNPIGLVQAGVGMVQGQNPQAGLVLGMLPILGLDHLRGFGGAMDAATEGFDMTSKGFVYVDQPASGVLGVFNFPAVEQTPPAWVDESVASYGKVNWAVEDAYSAVETIVDQFQGPGALSRVLDGLAEDGDGPQIHPKKDIIDQLSGAVEFVTDPPQVAEDASPVPMMVVAVGLKDGKKVAEILATASKSEGFPGKTRQFESQTVYELPLNESMLSVAVSGNSLLLGTDSKKLEGAIQGKTAKPLTASAQYKAIAKHFPQKTSMIGFQRSEGQIKMLYDTLRKQDNDEFEGIDMKKLPEWSVIAKYFQPSGSYVVPDKKGALFVGFALETPE